MLPLKLGYKASAEQFAPRELVELAVLAEQHGMESVAERRAAGKRENGRLTVSARQSGNQIIIEIADDGRGIDTDKLIARIAAPESAAP